MKLHSSRKRQFPIGELFIAMGFTCFAIMAATAFMPRDIALAILNIVKFMGLPFILVGVFLFLFK